MSEWYSYNSFPRRRLAGSNFDDYHIEWSEPSKYEIIAKIGGGRYSEVFSGLDMVNNDQVAIKVLKPVAAKKIKREINVLRSLSGSPNIVQLLDVVRDSSQMYHSLIMEHIDCVEWSRLYPVLTEPDVKHYLFQLLNGLNFCHARGIMHRDVKPSNFLIDPRSRSCRLIDWGLAEFYEPGTEYHLRVASRYYKGPELLVGYGRYSYSLDMWSTGCLFAAMIFRVEHFFRGSDNDDQLFQIMQVLGTHTFDHYLSRYSIPFHTHHDRLLDYYPAQPWTTFIRAGNELPTPEALDLLSALLKYDPHQRLTASEAQSHVYFNAVRLVPSNVKKEEISDSGFSSL